MVFQVVEILISPPKMTKLFLAKIFKFRHLHAFSRNFDMRSPKSWKPDQKIERRFSVFSSFRFSHFIPLVSRLGQSAPSTFSIMPKCSQRHQACKVLAQSREPSSSKIDLKALTLFFRTRHKSYVGLGYFRRYCGLKI